MNRRLWCFYVDGSILGRAEEAKRPFQSALD